MFASRLAWLAWAAVGMVFVSSLVLPTPTLPGNNAWLRRFNTPELSYALTLAQSFKMTTDGLQGVEFHPEPNGLPPSGDLRLSLFDVTNEGTSILVRLATVRAADVVREPSYRFAFAPIADSTTRTYRFEVTATDSSSGVVLRANRGNAYANGTLSANGSERWADLAFRASAPTTSVWYALWTSRGVGSQLPSGKLVIALLAAVWLLLGALFRLLVHVPWTAVTQSSDGLLPTRPEALR